MPQMVAQIIMAGPDPIMSPKVHGNTHQDRRPYGDHTGLIHIRNLPYPTETLMLSAAAPRICNIKR